MNAGHDHTSRAVQLKYKKSKLLLIQSRGSPLVNIVLLLSLTLSSMHVKRTSLTGQVERAFSYRR